MTPEELLQHAKEIGLSGLSITDHDTIDAYAQAIPAAKKLGLLIGTGVEFSSTFRKESIHVLGYNFDLSSPAIRALCSRHAKRRTERNKAILEKLAQKRMPISEEELAAMGTHSLGRLHIAQLMVKKGYAASIKDAFNNFIGDGKSCYVAGDSISTEETLEVLHQAGGKAFIAHPHLIDRGRVVKELLKLPFDGIECHYARFSADQEAKWIAIAKEKNWLISGGSDFHGTVKDYIPLGCSWVDEETFYKIFPHDAL